MNYRLMGGTGGSKWGGGGGPSPSKPPSRPPKSPKEKEPEKGGSDLDGYDSEQGGKGGKREPRKPSEPGKYVDVKVSVCSSCHYEDSSGVAGMRCNNCGKGNYETKEVKRLLKDKKWIKSKEDIERQRKARGMAEGKEAKADRLARQEYISKKGQAHYKRTGEVPTTAQRKEWDKGFEADLKKTLARHEVKWRADHERMFGKLTDSQWKDYLTKTATTSAIPKTRTWAEGILKLRGKK